jgi:FtsP/CotA-like multicopper oxidase with cupredoxin domain
LAIPDENIHNKEIKNEQTDKIIDQDNQQENKSKIDQAKPYTFNKKVILGIAIIISISAIITFFAMGISQSPSINIPLSILPLGEKSSSISITNAINPIIAQSPNSPNVDKRFILIQKDFGWNGTNLGPNIEVSKGDVVQIVIINAGTMAHNFGIAKISPYSMALLNETVAVPTPERINHISYNDMSAHHCPECESVFPQAHIDIFMKPLSQQVITFTANEAGEFKYFCMVRGHLWLGMFGDFIVKEKVV